MERTIPPPLSLALSILRIRQGWTQKELSEATGIPANLLSDYERGRKTLTRERLDLLLSAMGLQPAKALREAMRFLQEEAREPAFSGPEGREIEEAAAESASLMAELTRSVLTLWTSRGQAMEARQKARTLWERLKPRDAAQRKLLVEKVADFRNWALSELLCEESIKAAGDSADRALELANLALHVAELSPGEEASRQRVQGYAWAHVGNARRVRSDLPGADEAFARYQKLWSAGAGGDSGLLEEARVLDLEASLRRDQTHFEKCLQLLNLALAADRGHLRKHLLVNKANALLALGSFEEAIDVLHQVTSLVESGDEPRLLFAMKFNLTANLSFLGRYKEAELILPHLRTLAATLGNDVDFVRLNWLAARIAAGTGRRDKAIEGLSSVREDFASRGLSYDMALVSLELSVFYLEDDRISEVRALARQMAPVFRAQGVHREAMAALKVFLDAVEREVVTVELVRKLVKYFLRAQYDPSLQFED